MGIAANDACDRRDIMGLDSPIMIVDDDDANVIYMSQILEDHGFEYVVAKDGAEALEKMEENPPRLVLLDIMMPRKSGVGVFHRMKGNSDLASIPIIVVTGASRETGVDMRTGEERPKESYDDDFARGFGAILSERLKGLTPDGFIEKPIEPSALVAKIRELLH
jgi:twitching motility two-component system response regulator PilH